MDLARSKGLRTMEGEVLKSNSRSPYLMTRSDIVFVPFVCLGDLPGVLDGMS